MSIHTAAQEDRSEHRAEVMVFSLASCFPISNHIPTHQVVDISSHRWPNFTQDTASSTCRFKDYTPLPSHANSHVCLADFPSKGKRPQDTSDTPTTHILAFIWDFTWILALLSGEVGHLACQIC